METSEIPHDPRHLGVPSGASKMISEALVRSTQTVHQSCIKISTIYERTELSFHFSHTTQWYHQVRAKMISESMVRLAQTMHLSCTDTNSVSKWKQVRFHMAHVT
jgi:hypothetical protein